MRKQHMISIVTFCNNYITVHMLHTMLHATTTQAAKFTSFQQPLPLTHQYDCPLWPHICKSTIHQCKGCTCKWYAVIFVAVQPTLDCLLGKATWFILKHRQLICVPECISAMWRVDSMNMLPSLHCWNDTITTASTRTHIACLIAGLGSWSVLPGWLNTQLLCGQMVDCRIWLFVRYHVTSKDSNLGGYLWL